MTNYQMADYLQCVVDTTLKYYDKEDYAYDVGIICSVRNDSDKEYIEAYVEELEKKNIRTFYPARDTVQVDATGGIRICNDNCNSLRQCKEIHIIFHPDSKGSLFDLGVVFAMGKPIHIVNPILPTEEKSFKNVLLSLQEKNKDEILFNIEFDREIEVR